MNKKLIGQDSGFTLVELIAGMLVLVLAFVGILTSYMKCLELSELSINSSNAVLAAQNRVEQIKNTVYDQIQANFHNVTFTNANLNGIGVSLVDSSNPEFLQVTVVFCWRQKSGRILGEDANLNGQLNAGEDVNGNGALDSPSMIGTSIYNG